MTVTSAEFSLALTVTSGNNYDVFVYSNAGTATLELSAAWTNATTRSVALAMQDGIWVKSSDHSRRYVGTIRATGTNTTEDSALNRFVYNYRNQQRRPLLITDSTSSWTYSGSWREARGQITNVWNYVTGMAYEVVTAQVMACASAAINTGNMSVGVGIDNTNANSAILYGSGGQNQGALPTLAFYRGSPGLGYHQISWIEQATTGGEYYGNANLDNDQIAGMSGEVMA
jgi:hypothetical protein